MNVMNKSTMIVMLPVLLALLACGHKKKELNSSVSTVASTTQQIQKNAVAAKKLEKAKAFAIDVNEILSKSIKSQKIFSEYKNKKLLIKAKVNHVSGWGFRYRNDYDEKLQQTTINTCAFPSNDVGAPCPDVHGNKGNESHLDFEGDEKKKVTIADEDRLIFAECVIRKSEPKSVYKNTDGNRIITYNNCTILNPLPESERDEILKKIDLEREEAWIMAQKFVTDHLLVPDSADFGGLGIFSERQRSDDTVYRSAQHKFHVGGWVKSKNAFNVQLKHRFTMKLEHDGDIWHMSDLNFIR